MANEIKDMKFAPDAFELAHKDGEKILDVAYSNKSFFKEVVQSFAANKGAVIGLICITIIILMAIFAPMMTSHTFKSSIIEHSSLPARIPFIENLGIFDGTRNGVNVYDAKGLSDIYYWFGTDTQGRDLFTRVWEGTRISLLVAVVAVVIDMGIGMSYGLISGYFGGMIDTVMQRFVEILNSIPSLVIVTLLTLILTPGLESTIIALVLTGWIGMSRISRAQVLKLKEQEFVLASKTLGETNFPIIFKEILPNIFGQLIIMSMFSIPNAIFTEAFLAFVGLGIQAPMASLGVLVNEGYKSLTAMPHMILFPIIVLAILMLSFTLLADGLRDAFDPKMKQM